MRQAAKYQTPDGRKVVRLTRANLTPTFDDSQSRLLSNYDVRIKTESDAYGRRVPSEDKVYRVSVTRQMEESVTQ